MRDYDSRLPETTLVQFAVSCLVSSKTSICSRDSLPVQWFRSSMISSGGVFWHIKGISRISASKQGGHDVNHVTSSILRAHTRVVPPLYPGMIRVVPSRWVLIDSSSVKVCYPFGHLCMDPCSFKINLQLYKSGTARKWFSKTFFWW